MTTTQQKTHPAPSGTDTKSTFKRMRRKRAKVSLFNQGEPMVWLMGAGMVISIVMIIGLLLFIVYQGITTLWPKPLESVVTYDGKTYMGVATREETYAPNIKDLEAHDEQYHSGAVNHVENNEGKTSRTLLRTGNFDLTGEHFNWVEEYNIKELSFPEEAVTVERTSWGIFYGFPKSFILEGTEVASTYDEVWEYYNEYHDDVRKRREKQKKLETFQIGKLNHKEEQARLNLRETGMKYGEDSKKYAEQKAKFDEKQKQLHEEYDQIREQIQMLEDQNNKYKIKFITNHDKEKIIPLAEIVRAFSPNQLSVPQKIKIYLSRWWEFLSAEPREANSEGGVFPAIFGTVVMTVVMSLAVVPFGVMAALYLREYAKAGLIVSTIRISINNLAGVPSIVFGVFGLGFFCYMLGGTIDDLFFAAKLPNPTFGKGGVLWAAFTLALLTLPVVIVATEEALAAVPNSMREGSYACGASKWQTIKQIVLPRAMPGIMTGMILAMARGAGEVAPLMLVGAVKLAPELPVDGMFPYIHLQRSFMHLGFHIYDLGFQSQNSEAAKPMVFTTTLLLIGIVFILNIFAVWLRTKLRKKFVSAKF